MTNRVVIERTYDRSPESVFNAWVDVDLLRLWFGCGPDTLWEIHEWDVVVGGRLRVSMEMDDRFVEMTGEFLEVDRPQRLRYRWGGDQMVTVDFVSIGSGCKLVITHDGLPDDMMLTVDDGWTSSVTQLESVVTGGRPPDRHDGAVTD